MKFLIALIALTSLAQDLTITNARLAGSDRRVTIVTHAGRITLVSDSAKPPDGAIVLDAAGRTVSAGLFDLHTHTRASAVAGEPADIAKNAKAYLYCGVTSLIELSSQGEMFEPIRRLIPGPHMQIASRLSTPGGHGVEGGRGEVFTLEVLTPRQATAAVKKVLPYKPDVIKVFTDGWRYGVATDMTSMDEPTLKAIVTEAHKSNIPVVTHTVTLDKAKIAVRAGVDALIHGIGDQPIDDEFIRLIKASGTVYTPTLSVYRVDRNGMDDTLNAVLSDSAASALAKAKPATIAPATARRWKNMNDNVAKLYAAGVPIGVGTDAGMAGTYHGWATHQEMKLLVAAGLKPQDALNGATTVAAKLLHVEADRGSIAEGKLADLVLYDGQPDQNISDIDKIWKVIYAGKELDRAALSAAIKSPGLTVYPAITAERKIDDFERNDGRTTNGALRINSTDPGHDHAQMLFERTLRAPGNHGITILAKMTDAQKPFGRLTLPLRRGAMEPVDASKFHGIEFLVRGEGKYDVILSGQGKLYRAPVLASGSWKKIRVPFTAFAEMPADAAKLLYALEFEVAREPGEEVWLELDDIVFY